VRDRDEGRSVSDVLLASLEESARYGHPTLPLDRSAAADVWGEIVAGRKRITELEAALRMLVELETNRYACGAHWYQCFKDARAALEGR
jgi:hypothetical protein